MQLFRKEQHLPSNIIDRDSMRNWKEAGSLDTYGRAKLIVNKLLASYEKPELDPAREAALRAFMLDLTKKTGMDALPVHDLSPSMV